MEVGRSVSKAIDEFEAGDLDAAMLHACNAVDGTAKKALPTIQGSNERFTTLIRGNYKTFGALACPNVDLAASYFPPIVPKPKAPGGKPDIADVIYGIHRCCHGHGEALPDGFQLLPDTLGSSYKTSMLVSKRRVHLSDRTIFGLLGLAVFNPVNTDQKSTDGYYLTLGDEHKFVINRWWGRQDTFEQIVDTFDYISVVMDLNDGWADISP